MDKSKLRNKNNPQAGFSLIEILVVLAIIGVISGVVLVALSSARDKGREGRVEADLHQLQTAVGSLQADTGKWPNGCPTDNSVTVDFDLDTPTAGIKEAPAVGVTIAPCEWTDQEAGSWRGVYADHTQDSWGRSYRFHAAYITHCEGTDPVYKAVIYSTGTDGVTTFPFDSSCNPQTTDDIYQLIE